MSRVPHAVQALLIWIIVLLLYDAALQLGLIPRPTLTVESRAFSVTHPVAWHAIFFGLTTFLYVHLRKW